MQVGAIFAGIGAIKFIQWKEASLSATRNPQMQSAAEWVQKND
jgi:hypothetical protein